MDSSEEGDEESLSLWERIQKRSRERRLLVNLTENHEEKPICPPADEVCELLDTDDDVQLEEDYEYEYCSDVAIESQWDILSNATEEASQLSVSSTLNSRQLPPLSSSFSSLQHLLVEETKNSVYTASITSSSQSIASVSHSIATETVSTTRRTKTTTKKTPKPTSMRTLERNAQSKFDEVCVLLDSVVFSSDSRVMEALTADGFTLYDPDTAADILAQRAQQAAEARQAAEVSVAVYQPTQQYKGRGGGRMAYWQRRKQAVAAADALTSADLPVGVKFRRSSSTAAIAATTTTFWHPFESKLDCKGLCLWQFGNASRDEFRRVTKDGEAILPYSCLSQLRLHFIALLLIEPKELVDLLLAEKDMLEEYLRTHKNDPDLVELPTMIAFQRLGQYIEGIFRKLYKLSESVDGNEECVCGTTECRWPCTASRQDQRSPKFPITINSKDLPRLTIACIEIDKEILRVQRVLGREKSPLVAYVPQLLDAAQTHLMYTFHVDLVCFRKTKEFSTYLGTMTKYIRKRARDDVRSALRQGYHADRSLQRSTTFNSNDLFPELSQVFIPAILRATREKPAEGLSPSELDRADNIQTWSAMLQMIPQVSLTRAREIVRHFPSPRELFDRLHTLPDATSRDALVMSLFDGSFSVLVDEKSNSNSQSLKRTATTSGSTRAAPKQRKLSRIICQAITERNPFTQISDNGSEVFPSNS